MNAQERKIAIRLLEVAKTKFLWRNRADVIVTGRYPAVCWAIEHAANYSPKKLKSKPRGYVSMRKAVQCALIDRITESIGSHTYVSTWLLEQSPEFYALAVPELGDEAERLAFDISDGKLRVMDEVIAYRRAWVDDMIRTLKNGGEL